MGSYAKTNKSGNANFWVFFIGVDGVSVRLVCDRAPDFHKNGYIGKHPEGALDILLSPLFINTFNTN